MTRRVAVLDKEMDSLVMQADEAEADANESAAEARQLRGKLRDMKLEKDSLKNISDELRVSTSQLCNESTYTHIMYILFTRPSGRLLARL